MLKRKSSHLNLVTLDNTIMKEDGRNKPFLDKVESASTREHSRCEHTAKLDLEYKHTIMHNEVSQAIKVV